MAAAAALASLRRTCASRILARDSSLWERPAKDMATGRPRLRIDSAIWRFVASEWVWPLKGPVRVLMIGLGWFKTNGEVKPKGWAKCGSNCKNSSLNAGGR